MLVIQERTNFENFPWHPVNVPKAVNGHSLWFLGYNKSADSTTSAERSASFFSLLIY
jgi:hypothetical protein